MKLHIENYQRHNKDNNKQTGIKQNNNRHTKREKVIGETWFPGLRLNSLLN
jgi:hypothetical protein